MRALLHKYLPTQFHDPVGLSVRLFRSRDPSAHFAILTALLGLLCAPLDLAFQPAERRRYAEASAPALPLIFVVGPPRSGTTLVAQVLIKHLPVTYLNNLTAVFPRSPITANAIFGKYLPARELEFRSYYGKSRHFSGPNDALYIWDRWLGTDRAAIPTQLDVEKRNDMVRFFGAMQRAELKPIVNKVNRLVTCAHLVAETLPNAYFICLERDPLHLSQSLLRARLEIHGDASMPYGAASPMRNASTLDYVEDVCGQVRFHQQLAEEQGRRIGPDRFWMVSYEDFCRDPVALVQRVSERILDRTVDREELSAKLRPFEAVTRQKVDPTVLASIQSYLAGASGSG